MIAKYMRLPFLPVSLSLSPLSGVENFRPVSSRVPGLFRSATLDRATAEDASYLIDELNVTTVVELRNADEMMCPTSPGADLLFGSVERVHLPLMADIDALFFAVVASLPPLRKLQAYALLATDARGFDELVRTELSRDGPGLLYSSILASAQPAVAEAVERCLSASPEAAVVVNCAKGKDRTGIVSALVGLEAGDGDDVVVAEYARSESLLKDRGGGERTGSMDWSKLQGSPMEAMVEALGWLRREHGTVENYLKT